jgi:serine O-acetyltransferase
MIQSKADYKYYLLADKIALLGDDPRHQKILWKRLGNYLLGDECWKFEKALRKTEYLQNCCQHTLLGKFRYAFAFYRLHQLSIKLNFYINPNCFGPGLSISHPGTIIVHDEAKIGSNCRIHPGVTIGLKEPATDTLPKLGNNIYIGAGAKIYDKIEIADSIVIGANSVVNKSFNESGITIAGIPAKKVSNNGSDKCWIMATDIIEKDYKNAKNVK